MAVISYNESKSGNNSLIVHGNEEELKEVAEFVNSMYDKPVNDGDNVDMVKSRWYLNKYKELSGSIIVFNTFTTQAKNNQIDVVNTPLDYPWQNNN